MSSVSRVSRVSRVSSVSRVSRVSWMSSVSRVSRVSRVSGMSGCLGCLECLGCLGWGAAPICRMGDALAADLHCVLTVTLLLGLLHLLDACTFWIPACHSILCAGLGASAAQCNTPRAAQGPRARGDHRAT